MTSYPVMSPTLPVTGGAIALGVRNLTRSFGEIYAVHNLAFDVLQGSITAFLGRNGAGKTTTLNCLTGLITPDDGQFTLFNQSLDKVATRKRIGVLPQDLGLFEELTVLENLETQARLFGVPSSTALSRRMNDLLDTLLLTEERDRRCKTLSAGTRKRAAFAVSVVHGPEFLFLDEPFENVDPIGVIAMKNWMRKYVGQDNGSILLTTHVLDTVEKLCDHAMILDRGELVWSGDLTPDRILEWSNAHFSSLEDLFVAISTATKGTKS